MSLIASTSVCFLRTTSFHTSLSLIVTIGRFKGSNDINPGSPSQLSGSTLTSSTRADSSDSQGMMDKEKVVNFFRSSHDNAKKVPSKTSHSGVRLVRLESDIKIFFFGVVPASILFMIFSIWLGTSLRYVLSSGVLLELATIGFMWVGTIASLSTLTFLTIKTFLNMRSSSSTSSSNSSSHGSLGVGSMSKGVQVIRLTPNACRDNESDVELDIKSSNHDFSTLSRGGEPSPPLSDYSLAATRVARCPATNHEAEERREEGATFGEEKAQWNNHRDEEQMIGSTTHPHRYSPRAEVWVEVEVQESRE